jgi:hypothetical protein
MTLREGRRAPTVLVPGGVIVRAVLVVLVLMAAAAIAGSGVLQRAATGTTVADSATVLAQQAAAARNIARGYDQSTEQVQKARALKLAIPAQQAETIATKALADLRTLRHSALVSLAQTTGASADGAEQYAKSTEQAQDAARGTPVASTAPVLLAPRFYAIVSRFDQLAAAISDQATTDLTQSPTTSPAPSARPTPTPTR